MNALYYGDNLDVLRESIKDESVDLIYLDPPFNSNATYNVLFKTPKGHQSDAQIEAFDDTWHWGPHAEAAFAELMQQPNTDVAEVTRALRSVLGENDMMAYLTMMAIRLLELRRVLKPTGSLYLHCDPTASHYLKIVLDQVFGVQQFRNEIVWKRSDAHSDAKQGAKHYGRVHDVLLFYSKRDDPTYNSLYRPLPQSTIDNWYRNVEEGTGRRYNKADTSGPGGAAKGNPYFEWNGVKRYWRYNKEKMEAMHASGRLIYSKSGIAYEKRYLDESKGVPLQDFWDDVSMLRGISGSGERLGYPTQKPLALLERIIEVSSNEGDLVLDPFCGCGTAVHAAEKLKRKWIGIDVTHLAVSLIEKRMRDAFPNIAFEVHGTPKDIDGARDLAMRDKYQFQWWACSLVNAQPFQGKKKGADSGIDGVIYFQDDENLPKKIVVSVKGGENVSVPMVRDFAHVIDREKAAMGFFVTLTDPTRHMVTEGVGTGYYTSPLTGAKFPKLQVLTIEGLLSGKEQARYPRMDAGGLTFKKARREDNAPDQGALKL
jgi:DNA modification methylase